jgi:hypothetical protein
MLNGFKTMRGPTVLAAVALGVAAAPSPTPGDCTDALNAAQRCISLMISKKCGNCRCS